MTIASDSWVGDYLAGRVADLGHEQAANVYFDQRARADVARRGTGKRDAATFGAIRLDAEGCLAAGAVTGGVRGQPPGRMGAPSLVGAGRGPTVASPSPVPVTSDRSSRPDRYLATPSNTA